MKGLIKKKITTLNRNMSKTLRDFCNSLTARGFSLWFYDSKQSRSSEQVSLSCEFAVVCGFPAYFFKDAKTYKDVPIAVYGFDTQKAMRAKLLSIGCGGHYKFIRTFQSGKDTTNYADKGMRTRVPDPNSPTVSDNSTDKNNNNNNNNNAKSFSRKTTIETGRRKRKEAKNRRQDGYGKEMQRAERRERRFMRCLHGRKEERCFSAMWPRYRV